MKKKLSAKLIFSIGLLALAISPLRAENETLLLAEEASTSDATESNSPSVDDKTVTPFDQHENEVDVGITADIRKAIMAKDSFSVNAQNIKIITKQGVVTLLGSVKNEDEAKQIYYMVLKTPNVKTIQNRLDILKP